jgi:hypothetical protein
MLRRRVYGESSRANVSHLLRRQYEARTPHHRRMRPLTQQPTEPQWRFDLTADACRRIRDGMPVGSAPPLDALDGVHTSDYGSGYDTEY